MADPVSILAIVDGSVGLALKCAGVIKSLHDIAGKHKKAAVTIMSMVTEIDAIELAWNWVEKWAKDYSKDITVDVALLQRLDRSLDSGTRVISALQKDLSQYNNRDPRLSFGQRSKAVWNETALKDHQHRVRGQAGAMVLLLQVLQLPTQEARRKLLQESSHALQDSDESAYSIVPSRRSLSIHSFVSQMSVKTTDLTYQRLSFEEDLFAARVYKRRYGNPVIHSVFRNNVQSASERREIEHPTSLVTRRSTTMPNDLKGLSPESSLQSQAPSRNKLATSKPYETSRQKFNILPLSEKRAIDFDLPALFKRFPYRDDLKGKIGNHKDPGDGLVYSDREVAEVKAVLHYSYQKWIDSIKWHRPMKTETFAKARKFKNMAKICLILRGMEQERLLGAFWDSGTTDINLPLNMVELERILKTDDLENAAVFATEQYRVVRRDWSDGGHLALLEREPLPFIVEAAFKFPPLYGSVERVRDSFIGAIYLRRDITHLKANAKEHLLRQAAHPKKFRHRHIVQVMKTYQRGAKHYILLAPNVSTDLKTLLSQHEFLDDEHRAREYRTALTAFGCLSRGLAHLHTMHATYWDITPDHIVYNAASETEGTAKFLWPDIHYGTIPDEFHVYRFWAKTGDILTFGAIMLSICNLMIGGEVGLCPLREGSAIFAPYQVQPGKLPGWIDKKLESLKEEHKDLEVILRLVRRMTQADEYERPLIEDVVEELAAAGSQYFCKECLEDLAAGSEKPKTKRSRGSKKLVVDYS